MLIHKAELCLDIWLLQLEVLEKYPESQAGQFISVKCGDSAKYGELIPRPFSIFDQYGRTISLIVATVGQGTKWLCGQKANAIDGAILEISQPRGRGFQLDPTAKYLLVGGGVGLAPLYYAACSLAQQADALLCFTTAERAILRQEFAPKVATLTIATDDGSYADGITGRADTALRQLLSDGKTHDYDGILSCGPQPMLRAVAEIAAKYSIPCQVSLEEFMGCGIGVCCGCAVKTPRNGVDSMQKVCTNGPVFDAEEVDWDA